MLLHRGSVWGPGGQGTWCFHRVTSTCYSFHTDAFLSIVVIHHDDIPHLPPFRGLDWVLVLLEVIHRLLDRVEDQAINLPGFRAGRWRNLRWHNLRLFNLRVLTLRGFNLRELNPWVGARPLGRWRIGIGHDVYSQNESSSLHLNYMRDMFLMYRYMARYMQRFIQRYITIYQYTETKLIHFPKSTYIGPWWALWYIAIYIYIFQPHSYW